MINSQDIGKLAQQIAEKLRDDRLLKNDSEFTVSEVRGTIYIILLERQLATEQAIEKHFGKPKR